MTVDDLIAQYRSPYSAPPILALAHPQGAMGSRGGLRSRGGLPAGRKAADSAALAPSPTLLSGLTADDVTPVGDIDFSKLNVATVTLSDGNVITVTGAASGEKHWVQLRSSKDAALDAKAAGRAFEIAPYQYDAIFRPVEQMLAPKPLPPGKTKAPPTKKPVPSP